MKFKGTWIFSALVIIVAGFAFLDYQKSADREQDKAAEYHAYKNQNSENVKSIKLFKGVHLKEQQKALIFAIQRENNEWRMSQPVQERADQAETESYLAGLFSQELKPLESMTSKADELAQFGLDKPTEIIEIEFTDGKTSMLEVGSVRTFDDGYYVRKDGKDILVAATGFAAYLAKLSNDLRDKHLFASSGDVTAFAVKVKGQQPFRFVKGERGWTLEKKTNFQIDDSAFNEFLNKLKNLEADKVLTDAKTPTDLREHALTADKAAGLVTVNEAGKAEAWELVVGPTKDNKVTLTSSSTNAVFEAAAVRVAGLTPDLSYFQNKAFPFKFAQEQAVQIRILKKGEKEELRYAKDNGQWKAESKTSKEKVDSKKVDEFIKGLRGLSAVKYLGRGQWNSKAIQENRIQLLDGKTAQAFLLEWGGSLREQEQDLYLVKTSLADEVIAVSKNSVDEVINKSLTEDKPAIDIPGVQKAEVK